MSVYLLQFKESLKDVLQPVHDDYYLMRWIMGEFELIFTFVKHEAELDRNETSMLRRMCGFSMTNRKKNMEVRE